MVLDNNLKKIVLITGSNSDIGFAISLKFLKKGFFVCFNTRKKVSKKIFNKNISLLFKLGQDYQIFQGDITDKNYTNTMLKKINKDFGPIDLLINNAAKTDNILKKLSVDNYRNIFETNFFGALDTSISYLKSNNIINKNIINISSIVVKKGSYNFPAYAASKAAIDNITMSLSKIYNENRVMSLILAPTDTKKFHFNHKKSLNKNTIKLLSPTSVANKVFNIYSNNATYKSGKIYELIKK